MENETIVGVWRLADITRRNERGEIRRLYGPSTHGLAIYTASGFVSITLMAAERPDHSGGGDIRGGTPEEKQHAFDTYMSHCGRYTVEGETVVHHIEMSLFPNWTGTDQRRSFRCDGGQLIVRTSPILSDGDTWVYELVWIRASP